jgi:general secretion pathway protein L
MRSFFDWWFDQLAGLVPGNVLRASAGPSDAIILEIDGHTVRLIIRRNGTRTRAGEARADESGFQELANLLTGEVGLPRTVVLRLPPHQVLHKHVTLPAAARSDLEDVLGFEIDRETPFGRDEVHWTHCVRAKETVRNTIDVDLVLAPRSFVDPVIAAARRAGIEPAAIEVDTGSGATALIGLDSHSHRQWLGLERPLMPLAVSAVVLAFLALVMPFAVQQWALASAEATIASLTERAGEAAKLRQSVALSAGAADFLSVERNQNSSPITILAAATRSLPDDTYLTSLSVRDGKVTMSGLSPSAAELIGVLARAPGFHDPAFDAPVVQNEDSGLENFTISVALAPAVTP